MRFISKYKRYVIWFQREKLEHYATGESRELQPGIVCEFDLYGSMTPWEIVAARETFTNYGLPTEVDMVTHIDALTRVSVFDSEICQQRQGFSDEKRLEMEAFLLGRPEYGVDFVMVEEPRLPAPWPTYDDFRGVRGLPTAQAIAKKVEEDGFAVADVVAYERQNANRTDVVDALESIGAVPVASDEELVEA